MKPSEALTAIQMLGALVADLEARAEGARALDTSIRSELDAKLIDLETAGERAAVLVVEEHGGPEETAPFAAIVKEVERDMAEPAPYGRLPDGTPKKKPGRKASKPVDDAAPKKGDLASMGATVTPIDPTDLVVSSAGTTFDTAKPHVAPLSSPLTPELRERLTRTLGAGPMTAAGIARMSWAVDLDAEKIAAALEVAPETFIRWEREERVGSALTKVDVWGLEEHFDRAVRLVVVYGNKADRVKETCEALGCSVSAALAAWARLDPEAT